MLTVAICTRNRSDSLARTLQSFTKLTIPPGIEWELIVVDNGSTDNTQAVLSQFTQLLPLRSVIEPNPGLSNARNRAVDEARGDYIMWTDDDVIVDKNWFASYVEAFHKYPDAAVFGGKILLILEPPTPNWFQEYISILRSSLAYRDFGDVPVPLSIVDERIPYGANFAIRTQEQRAMKYDPRLGVAPYQSRLGEETTVICKILEGGASGIWVPGSIVQHCIPPARQTTRYIFQFHRAAGETMAFTEGRFDVPFIFSAPRWLWRRMMTRFLRYHWDRLTASPDKWIKSLYEYGQDRGAIDYFRKFRS